MPGGQRTCGAARAIPRFFSLTTSLLLIGSITAPSSAQQGNFEGIRDRYKESILFIRVVSRNRDGTGERTDTATGFIISERGHLLTAAHVVPTASPDMEVFYYAQSGPRDSQSFSLHHLDIKREYDVALFQLPPSRPWRKVTIGPADRVREDAPLFTLGFPERQDLSSATGILSNRFGPNGRYLTTLPLNRGNSGGPVFDVHQTVIGMAVGGFDHANSLTFIIPSTVFRSVMVDVPGEFTGPPEPARPPSPTVLPLPDGNNYFAIRGYTNSRRPSQDAECLSEYIISDLTITDGIVSFKSGFANVDGQRVRRTWKGAYNKQSGRIEIKFEGITPRPNNRTSISGPYWNARMFNELCREGFFRIEPPR